MIETHGRGRPLRFLLLVLLCWAGGRVAASHDWWSGAPLPRLAILPKMGGPAYSKQNLGLVGQASIIVKAFGQEAAFMHVPLERGSQRSASARHASEIAHIRAPSPTVTMSDKPPATSGQTIPGQTMPGAPLVPQSSPADRWSVSGWLFWRDAGGGASLAGGGQLGGSQAGVRVAYQLIPEIPERLAVYARVTSALRRPNAPEAAVGLSVQPFRAIAVRLAVERRVALDRNARNAFAVMAVGGIGPLNLPGKMVLEGYGQAGIVGMRSRDAFADGKVTLLHAVHDTLPVSAGLSVSGGAQPNVARLDIGPQVEAKLKLGNQPARISAEWRQRVAGNARPGSGPAITLAADF